MYFILGALGTTKKCTQCVSANNFECLPWINSEASDSRSSEPDPFISTFLKNNKLFFYRIIKTYRSVKFKRNVVTRVPMKSELCYTYVYVYRAFMNNRGMVCTGLVHTINSDKLHYQDCRIWIECTSCVQQYTHCRPTHFDFSRRFCFILGFQFSLRWKLLGIASLLKYRRCILRINWYSELRKLISVHSTKIAIRCIRIISYIWIATQYHEMYTYYSIRAHFNL